MKIKIPEKLSDYFSSYKNKFNHQLHSYDEIKTFFGKLWWNTPNDVIWLYSTDREEDYEGSQTQIGIKKDGTVVWGFYSHCSCNSYSECEGEYEEFESNEDTFKQYEMNEVDKDVLVLIKDRIKKMVKIGLKDSSSGGEKE